MSSQFRAASLTAIAVVVLAGAVAGFASGSSVHTIRFMTITPVKTLDFPPRGKSPGDVYVFAGTVLSTTGHTVIGRLRGSNTAIKLEHGVETLQGLLTFELGAGNEIVIGGLSAYPLKGTGLVKGKAYVRPVLGGTGRYAGAKGTDTATRVSGVRYRHVLRLTY